MSRLPHSEFARDVFPKDEVLPYVLRVHLHVERWLHELLGQAETKGRNPDRFTFVQLVTECAKQQVLPSDLAAVVRKLNTLRNNYAHVRGFKPTPKFIADFLRSLRELENPFSVSLLRPSRRELCRAIASLSGYLQRMAIEGRNVTSNKPLHPILGSGAARRPSAG